MRVTESHEGESRSLRPHLHGAFGNDRFGVIAERFARWFGTPKFIIGQSIVVAAWIAANVVLVALRWDAYPFILLNLAFSTQAAYAAPLILLAQTRQAERDKATALAFEAHRDVVADQHLTYQRHIAELLEQQAALTRQIDALIAVRAPAS